MMSSDLVEPMYMCDTWIEKIEGASLYWKGANQI